MKRMMQRLRPLQWVLAPAIMLLAAIGLWRQIHLLSLLQLNVALSETPTSAIALSLLATVLSFACLSWYEWFATCRTMPGRIPARIALVVGAMSHAISNTLGFHALTGGALRYRAYHRLGLDLAEVVRVLAVVAMCVGTGVVLVSVIALSIEAASMINSNVILAIVGMAFLLAVFAFRLRRSDRNLASGILSRYAGLSMVAALEMTAAIARCTFCCRPTRYRH